MHNPYATGYIPLATAGIPPYPPELAPQGIWGNVISQVAPVAGQALGRAFGNQHFGSTVGNAVGSLGSLLPFSAGPGQVQYAIPGQYAPQGIFGDILKTVAPVAGGLIGGALGNQQIGTTIGNAAGQVGGLLPFSAGPEQAQYAPQGFWGNIVKHVAPTAGRLIGGALGHQQAGSTIGNVAGQLGGFLPFSAGPQQVQYAPQGFFGDLVKTVAPVAGGLIGGALGNQQAGSTIGNVAGQLGGLIPFSAGPGQPVQYAPQGFFGDLVQQLAPVAGGLIGGALGQQQAGSAIGNVAGQLGGLIPFSAGPGQPVQYAPQGFFGDLVQQIAPVAGGLIGGALGQQQAGSVIGNVAGQLGGLIPFSAGPGQPVQYAPQGIFGDILSVVAPIAGTVAGGFLGQPILGGLAGNAAGQAAKMIPFSAGPEQMYGQPTMVTLH